MKVDKGKRGKFRPMSRIAPIRWLTEKAIFFPSAFFPVDTPMRFRDWMLAAAGLLVPMLAHGWP